MATLMYNRHGKSKTSEYEIWKSMKKRCYYLPHVAYARYGGRGIKVCDRWLQSFENFYADMGDRPKGMSLDRIDNDGDYTPDNCKWSTRHEQQHNRRITRSFGHNNSKTGYIGVIERIIGKRKVYAVRIRIDGIQRHIGNFDTSMEAAYVYDQIILQTKPDGRSDLNLLKFATNKEEIV